MKKILLTLFVLLTTFAAEAKIIKIVFADGSTKVYTSSQLSAIDFSEEGYVTVTGYDGQILLESEGALDMLTIDEDEAVYEQKSDVLLFDMDVDGMPIKLNDKRPVTRLNYFYPSTDPFGEPISLSGTIIIPDEIWNGEKSSEGIMLFNHYTVFHRDEAPTRGYAPLESMFMANPLKPNYIVVESDFYGFGSTVRFPQAFLQGTNNARASLDGLLAARRILEEMGIDYGPLCFNLGYSSGGFDALATQKLRDMEYADRVSFDKTFAGGGPYDLAECYRQYVTIDSTAYNAVPLLLIVSTKETQRMDIEYTDVFQPGIANRIDKLIHSKNFSSWPVCDSVGREKKVHEILTPEYCDLNKEGCQTILSIFHDLSIATGWVPDPSQRLFIYHSRGDDYVPVQSARGIVKFLQNNGFEASIVPGKTNLQTNFLVRDMGHLTATVVYLIQSLAAIEAWPEMYTNGQLNPIYASIISGELDLVATMRRLDAMGIDCRAIIKEVLAQLSKQGDEEAGNVEFNPMTIMVLMSQACEKMGITFEELNEMCYDSGIDLNAFITDLIAYFSEETENAENDEVENVEGDQSEDAEDNKIEAASNRAAARLLNIVEHPTMTPAERYEQQLRQWLDK